MFTFLPLCNPWSPRLGSDHPLFTLSARTPGCSNLFEYPFLDLCLLPSLFVPSSWYRVSQFTFFSIFCRNGSVSYSLMYAISSVVSVCFLYFVFKRSVIFPKELAIDPKEDHRAFTSRSSFLMSLYPLKFFPSEQFSSPSSFLPTSGIPSQSCFFPCFAWFISVLLSPLYFVPPCLKWDKSIAWVLLLCFAPLSLSVELHPTRSSLKDGNQHAHLTP